MCFVGVLVLRRRKEEEEEEEGEGEGERGRTRFCSPSLLGSLELLLCTLRASEVGVTRGGGE